MSALVKARNQTISCIGWLEEAHRTSSHSVEYLNLNGARLGKSLECGRREGEIVYYFEHTPAPANVPMTFPIMVLSMAAKRNQQGILEGNAADHASLGASYSPGVVRKGSSSMRDKWAVIVQSTPGSGCIAQHKPAWTKPLEELPSSRCI
jgi:hypothetical protein